MLVVVSTSSASATGRADRQQMQHSHLVIGAPGSGAPFFWQVLQGILLLFCISQASHADDCAAGHPGERVRVVYVYDGDTVKLEDGRRLRFIGINTPETRHHDQAKQPYANEAKALLEKMLAFHNHTLRLQPGRERRDHYGRLLAHAFLENGENLAVRLLQEGLATTLVVPPNTWGHDCYQLHEKMARSSGQGLWSLDSYKSQQSQSLPRDTRGFRIIHGKVREVRHTRHNVWVELEGLLRIHISKKDIENFESGFLESLAGQHVETRGWVRPADNGLQLKVRHPAALTRLGKPGNTH